MCLCSQNEDLPPRYGGELIRADETEKYQVLVARSCSCPKANSSQHFEFYAFYKWDQLQLTNCVKVVTMGNISCK